MVRHRFDENTGADDQDWRGERHENSPVRRYRLADRFQRMFAQLCSFDADDGLAKNRGSTKNRGTDAQLIRGDSTKFLRRRHNNRHTV